mmetsp:Transcript_102092/g.243482  ORF Transcript_102092/g.243482 Transcript_102092/m.243482 type:complete len:84 (-) Transcript_102092:373-624(-)
MGTSLSIKRRVVMSAQFSTTLLAVVSDRVVTVPCETMDDAVELVRNWLAATALAAAWTTSSDPCSPSAAMARTLDRREALELT